MAIASLKENSRVKEYRVQNRCGSGTYGDVWKAKHRLGGTAAIKSFARLAQIVRQDRLLKEILREARAQALVEHENVVRLLDWEPKRACIIFEYLPSSLEKELKERRGAEWFPLDTTLEIVTGVLEGLRAIHEQQRVHGDLKPANVLLTERLTPKISDFGMASILSERKFPVPLFHGSNNWAPPEVLLGQPPDYRSDLFSLGIVAYVLLARQHPFRCGDPSCLWEPEEHITDPNYTPRPLKEINDSIPDGICEIVEKMLHRDPDRRYQSTDEVLMALSALQAPASAAIVDDLSVTSQLDAAREIADAVVDAKRKFSVEYNPGAALVALQALILKYDGGGPPFLANAYSYKAFVHNYLKEWDKAEAAASKGIELDPNHSDSYMARGYARMRRGMDGPQETDFSQAREDFENARLLAQDSRTRWRARKYLEHLP